MTMWDETPEYAALLERVGQGDIEAMRQIGEFWFKRDKDSRAAFEFFFRAANKNDAEAQYRIGSMLFHGQSKSRNLEQAGEWLLKAYHQGNMAAMIELGLMLEEGYVFAPTAFPYKSAAKCYKDALEKHKVQLAKGHLERLADQAIKAKARHGLDNLIGLASVKDQIMRLEKMIQFEAKRTTAGLLNPSQSHHFVFMGNPGTGKTEVARMVGGLFKTLGLLKSGHVIEVDRAGLIGEYRGETSAKVQKVIEKSLDGVLFIDEAHSLVTDTDGDYGEEALNLVMKAMEDHRHRLVVIMAGYEDAMKSLIRVNPGFKSRIKHQFVFPDYSEDELVSIFKKSVKDGHYILTETALERIQKLMKAAVKTLDKDLGNGRFVRNAFDRTIERMAVRVVNNGHSDKESLQTIQFTDIPSLGDMGGSKPPETFEDNVHPLHG